MCMYFFFSKHKTQKTWKWIKLNRRIFQLNETSMFGGSLIVWTMNFSFFQILLWTKSMMNFYLVDRKNNKKKSNSIYSATHSHFSREKFIWDKEKEYLFRFFFKFKYLRRNASNIYQQSSKSQTKLITFVVVEEK